MNIKHERTKELVELPSWRNGNKPDWEPGGCGFGPWSCSVGEGSGFAVTRGVEPALLWLWRRPAAVALIGLLAWELPYAADVALKSKKRSCGASPHI